MVFIVTYENPKTHKGFLTCWNIQNMDEPEIIVSTGSNPTVARFCSEFPRLVAVGDETGMVHFIDIGSQQKQLGADSVPGTSPLAILVTIRDKQSVNLCSSWLNASRKRY